MGGGADVAQGEESDVSLCSITSVRITEIGGQRLPLPPQHSLRSWFTVFSYKIHAYKHT